MNISAGQRKPIDLRGLVFSCQAIASSSSWVKPLRSLPLGRYSLQQTVGVLVDATLPGAVRIGEVHLHPGGLGEALMGGPFPVLIVSHRQTFLGLDATGHLTKTVEGGFGTGVVHSGQHREQGRALHQSAHCGTVIGPLDQVAFPVSRDQPLFDLRWPMMNADHPWNLTPPILAQFTAHGPTATLRGQKFPLATSRNMSMSSA